MTAFFGAGPENAISFISLRRMLRQIAQDYQKSVHRQILTLENRREEVYTLK